MHAGADACNMNWRSKTSVACLMSCTTLSTKKRSGGKSSTEVCFRGLSAAKGSTLHMGE